MHYLGQTLKSSYKKYEVVGFIYFGMLTALLCFHAWNVYLGATKILSNYSIRDYKQHKVYMYNVHGQTMAMID